MIKGSSKRACFNTDNSGRTPDLYGSTWACLCPHLTRGTEAVAGQQAPRCTQVHPEGTQASRHPGAPRCKRAF